MHKRWTLLIDKKFQYRFIRQNIVLLVFTFALIALALVVWQKFETEQGFLLRPPTNAQVIKWAKENNVRPDSAEFSQQFLRQAKVYTFFQLLWKPLLVVLLINVLVVVLANIYYSHKIIGPIYRIKKVLNEKLEGKEIQAIHFRDGDHFHDLGEILNKLLSLK